MQGHHCTEHVVLLLSPFPLHRKPHLQGRFSGRLTTKGDEKRLADECRLLGPLLGGVGKRGDGSRLTLAKIVRGIAAGDVRRHCEERERRVKVGWQGWEFGLWTGLYVAGGFWGLLENHTACVMTWFCFEHSVLCGFIVKTSVTWVWSRLHG